MFLMDSDLVATAVLVAFLAGMAVGHILAHGQAFRPLLVVALCAALSGCGSVPLSHSVSRTTDVLGVPMTGALRFGLGSQGVYLQPDLYMRSIQFGR